MEIQDNFEYNFEFLPEPVPITEQKWSKGTRPLVHTHTLTYNHEAYIEETIEGILMQKTTFPVVILIHEDCSTDNTASIVKKYQEKYPQLIKAYFQEENIYKFDRFTKQEKLKVYNSWQVGKYQAYCEGDDHWTDPLKLQKQVEFLESHQEYVLSAHDVEIIFERIKQSQPFSKKWTLDDFDIVDVINYHFIPTNSLLIRKNVFDVLPDWYFSCISKDIPLVLIALLYGKGKYFTEVMGVKRKTPEGISQDKNRIAQISSNFYMLYTEFNKYSEGKYINNLYPKIFKYGSSFCQECYKNRKYLKSLSIIYNLFVLNKKSFFISSIRKINKRIF